MANTRKYKNRYVTSLPVEKEDYERLNGLLPRGVSIVDEINKFIAERGKELEKEKNREGSLRIEHSPIKSDVYGVRDNSALETYICLYHDEKARLPLLYQMTMEELYHYGVFIEHHLREVSSVRFAHYRTQHRNIPIDTKIVEKVKNLVFGSVTV